MKDVHNLKNKPISLLKKMIILKVFLTIINYIKVCLRTAYNQL